MKFKREKTFSKIFKNNWNILMGLSGHVSVGGEFGMKDCKRTEARMNNGEIIEMKAGTGDKNSKEQRQSMADIIL